MDQSINQLLPNQSINQSWKTAKKESETSTQRRKENSSILIDQKCSIQSMPKKSKSQILEEFLRHTW